MQEWVKKIFGFGVASFLSDLSHEMTTSLIPTLIVQLVGPVHASFFVGIIASISDACASFLRIVIGFLSDTTPYKKPFIMAGYAVSALFTTLIGFTNSIAGITLFRVLAFSGNGLREPPRDALIATVIEPRAYGRAFGLQRAMDTLGSVLGPLITLLCIAWVSLPTIFMLSFIPGILAVPVIFFFIEDAPVAQRVLSYATWRHNISLLPRSFIIFLAIIFIFEVSYFNKLLLIARTQEILGVSTLSSTMLILVLYTILNITKALSEFVIGFLSDYFNRIILLALLGCGTYSILVALLITGTAQFGYCAGIFVLFGISSAAMTPLKKACAADMLPAEIRGLGYGVLQASEGVALLISSSLIGFMWSYRSHTLGFLYSITLSTIALVALLVFAGIFRTNQPTA